MKVKLKKTIPFVIGSATIKIGNKILGNNLTKMVKNLHNGNYGILLKQIKDNTNNGDAGCTHALET